MEINLKAIKLCAKSILQTKPPSLKGTDFAELKLKPLISDVIQITGSKFSKSEQEIMDSIKGLKVEDARVIDENGVLVKDLKFVGDELSFRFAPEQLENPDFYTETLPKLKNSTFIHNHPFNAPLSSCDIHAMAQNKIKKMTACTKNGGYSYLERLSDMTPEQEKLFKKASASLIGKEMIKINKLTHTRGITDIERMNRLNDWRYKEFGKFAQDFGLKFENKIDRLTDLESFPPNIFKKNLIDRIIDKFVPLKKPT